MLVLVVVLVLDLLDFCSEKGIRFPGTSALELTDYKKNSLRRHAPVKKQTQYADRAKAFALSSNPRSRHSLQRSQISEICERCRLALVKYFTNNRLRA